MGAVLNLQAYWEKACNRSVRTLKEEGRGRPDLPDRLPFAALDLLGEDVDIDVLLHKV